MVENSSEKETKEMVPPFVNCENGDTCFIHIGKEIKKLMAKRIDEGLKDIKIPPNEWKIFYRIERIIVRFPCKQPQHISEEEANAIKGLKKHHNYSVRDLAFIFNSSKSTIHEVLTRKIDNKK